MRLFSGATGHGRTHRRVLLLGRSLAIWSASLALLRTLLLGQSLISFRSIAAFSSRQFMLFNSIPCRFVSFDVTTRLPSTSKKTTSSYHWLLSPHIAVSFSFSPFCNTPFPLRPSSWGLQRGCLKRVFNMVPAVVLASFHSSRNVQQVHQQKRSEHITKGFRLNFSKESLAIKGSFSRIATVVHCIHDRLIAKIARLLFECHRIVRMKCYHSWRGVR